MLFRVVNLIDSNKGEYEELIVNADSALDALIYTKDNKKGQVVAVHPTDFMEYLDAKKGKSAEKEKSK